MGANLTSYLILLLMVVVVELFKDKVFSGNKSGTQVSAETQSPAQPIIIYESGIDQFLKENYPNAMR